MGKGTIDEDKKKGHAYNVVIELLKGYFGKGHSIYKDNFYNSIPLAKQLLCQGTQVVRTLRSNRVGIPKALKLKRLKKGESTCI